MNDDTQANGLAGGLIATALMDALVVRGHITHFEARAALKRAHDSLDAESSNPHTINARRAIGKLMNDRYADRE